MSKYYWAKNGGDLNIKNRKIYFFDVSNEGFKVALDKFAQFFICSTFNESIVEREIKAVDNKFINDLNKDTRRFL